MKHKINSRSPQLSPLSNEHKDGMEFVNRIREGLGKISPERLRDYTLWYWSNHIRPHFYHEEKILLPYFPPKHPLAVKLKEDHSYIRELVLNLDREADLHSLRLLCDIIATHIYFEEKEVFSYLEEHLETAELDGISEQLAKHPLEESDWKDIFWNITNAEGRIAS